MVAGRVVDLRRELAGMAPKAMEHEEEEVELFSRRLISATWKLVLGSFLLHVRTDTERERERG